LNWRLNSSLRPIRPAAVGVAATIGRFATGIIIGGGQQFGDGVQAIEPFQHVFDVG